MKKYILILITVLSISCSKSYTYVKNEQVPKKLTNIDLKNYTFYKREIYFKDESENDDFIKTSTKIDSNYIRYEIQIMGVENITTNDLKNVIYFSYIPPYFFNNKNIFDSKFYNDYNMINLNDINYIKFGKLDKSNRIKFINKKSNSIWNYTFNENFVSIDAVTFLNKGKMKTFGTSEFLNNEVIYKILREPKFVLYTFFNDEYNECYGNILKENTLKYDTRTNDIYFEFTKPIKIRGYINRTEVMFINTQNWVKYDNSRVKSNYQN